jgi:RimJ/RimL family protein N-acetyltransferase
MGQYKCLQCDEFSYQNYRIVPIRPQDIMLIKDWRNAQLTVLRQKQPITEAAQHRYFETVVWPSFTEEQPSQLLFSLLQNHVCIGYGGIVHISWEDRRGELSFLLNPARVAEPSVYRQDFLAFLSLIKQVAYHDLGFNRLFTETYDIRPFHISVLEEAGFRIEGRMKQHVCLDGAFVDSVLHGHIREYDNDVDQ